MELLVDPISNYPKKHYKIANKILCGGGGGGRGRIVFKIIFYNLIVKWTDTTTSSTKNPTPLLTQSTQIWNNPFSKQLQIPPGVSFYNWNWLHIIVHSDQRKICDIDCCNYKRQQMVWSKEVQTNTILKVNVAYMNMRYINIYLPRELCHFQVCRFLLCQKFL